jgi:RsiW-degrading membrane proteinase PrsW (M82 family)
MADTKKLGLKGMFSEVFRQHSVCETEIYFISGTPPASPDEYEIRPGLPRPWFFSRVLAMALLSYLGFYMGAFFFENANFLPGLIFFGSFMTPISLLIFFWEINILRNTSIYKLTMVFLRGSIIALLSTVIIYSLLDGNESSLLIGFVEETAKVLTLLMLANRKDNKYILNGMLIGAAIGTGFAAFESSGYILVSALAYGIKAMTQTIFWRALLAPGGHIAWSCLTGAAYLSVKGDRPLRISMLFNFRFLGVYLLVIILHTIWDMPISQLVIFNVPIFQIALTIISWLFLFRYIRKGIKQALNYQTESKLDNATEVSDNWII